MNSITRLAPRLSLVAALVLAPALQAQGTQEERPNPPINISDKPFFERGMQKLFCVAFECEDWALMFKWLAAVGSAQRRRFGKKRMGGNGPGAVTLSDTTDEPTAGEEPATEVWMADGNNVIMFNQDLIGGDRFINPDQAASDAIMAGAIAHEMTHTDDEYEFKGGKPATPADAKKLACEEVKGAECELKVLNAIKAGKCITPAELARIKKALCDRIKQMKNFRDANKKKAGK